MKQLYAALVYSKFSFRHYIPTLYQRRVNLMELYWQEIHLAPNWHTLMYILPNFHCCFIIHCLINFMELIVPPFCLWKNHKVMLLISKLFLTREVGYTKIRKVYWGDRVVVIGSSSLKNQEAVLLKDSAV